MSGILLVLSLSVHAKFQNTLYNQVLVDPGGGYLTGFPVSLEFVFHSSVLALLQYTKITFKHFNNYFSKYVIAFRLGQV